MPGRQRRRQVTTQQGCPIAAHVAQAGTVPGVATWAWGDIPRVTSRLAAIRQVLAHAGHVARARTVACPDGLAPASRRGHGGDVSRLAPMRHVFPLSAMVPATRFPLTTRCRDRIIETRHRWSKCVPAGGNVPRCRRDRCARLQTAVTWPSRLEKRWFDGTCHKTVELMRRINTTDGGRIMVWQGEVHRRIQAPARTGWQTNHLLATRCRRARL